MEKDQVDLIINKAKEFFKVNIAESHLEKSRECTKLKNFSYNPFLIKYLSKFAFGNTDSISLAKSLIYPRILGTSISTIFGNNMQNFISDVLSSWGSPTKGIDIEFFGSDGRRKYCQVKSGPQTINSDDVDTIEGHFKNIIRVAVRNRSDLRPSDCIVGVLYGKPEQLSGCYKKISKDYPVLSGKDFWEELTGEEDFYDRLITAFSEVADSISSSSILQKEIELLAEDINKNGI